MAERIGSDGESVLAVSEEEAKRRIDEVFDQAFDYIEEQRQQHK